MDVSATLQDVVSLMHTQKISDVTLLKENRPLGIVTERDILTLYQDNISFEHPAVEFAAQPVITTQENRSLEYVLSLMIDHTIRRIVAVDGEGNYVGTVEQEDIIFELESDIHKSQLKAFEMLSSVAQAVMIDAEATLEETLELMLQEGKSSVLISVGGRPEGIITERDVVNLVAVHTSKVKRVKEYMHAPLIVVGYDAFLHDIVTTMKRSQIRHIVVHDTHIDAYYVLSSRDVLHNIKGYYSNFLESKLTDSRQTLHTMDEAFIELFDMGDVQVVNWMNSQAKAFFDLHIDQEITTVIEASAWTPLLEEVRRHGHLNQRHITIKERSFILSIHTTSVLSTPIIKLLFYDVTELDEAKQRLKENLTQKLSEFAQIIDGNINEIHIINPHDFSYSYVNNSAIDVLGYSKEDFLKLSYLDITTFSKEELTDALMPLLSYLHDEVNIRGRQKSRSGEEYIVSMHVQRISFGGKEQLMLVVRNMTDEAVKEQESIVQHAMLRTVLNATPDLIFFKDYKDVDGHYLGCNTAFAKFVGRESDEIIGHNDTELFGEEIGNYFRHKDQKILNTQQSHSSEEWVTYPDGRRVLLDTLKTPLRDDEGQTIGVLGVSRDITEQKVHQERVRKQKEDLEYAQSMARIGNWELDVLTGELHWSKEIYNIFEIDPESFEASYEAFLNGIHPDDRDYVNEAYQTSLITQSPYSLTHRLLMADGRVKYVEENCITTFNAQGEPLISKGTVQDITEQMLVKSELVLSDVVFKNTQEGIMITDEKNRVVNVNDAFSRITGYTKDEIIGLQPSIIQSGKHDDHFYKQMWGTLQEEGSWQGEIWNRRKNGEVYPEWLNISVSRDNHGRVMNYIAVFSDITAIKESEKQLHYLAFHDALTGLPNRTLLNERIEHAISFAKREMSKMALLFIDLDNFKHINDTYGHDTGDEVLIKASQRLKGVIRESDTLARIGGDEFVVMLESITDMLDVQLVIKSIMHHFDEPIEIHGENFSIKASIGVAFYPDDAHNSDLLVKNADTAMYKAKEDGKGTYRYYTTEMTTAILEQIYIEKALQEAINDEQFQLFYQPQIDIAEGRVSGVEALVRWKHTTKGLIMPDRFIEHAEKSKLIIPLGTFVLQSACHQLKAWHDSGIFRGKVSVNVSSIQLRHTNFVAVLEEAITESGCDPRYLELEMTESYLMRDATGCIEILKALKKLGVKISIDDFGTGYSSLSYLKRFPIDRIKVDRSFIQGIPDDKGDKAITNAVIAMAESLDLAVVAEGVEKQEQLDYLKEHGCDTVQGFYFAKPMELQAFEAWLQEANGLT